MRLPTYTVPQVLAGNSRIIDLRSPAEFQRDHLPGAVNVPLLDDEQRAIVGTLYKRESPRRAFEEGLDIIEARMGRMLERILGRPVGASDWQQQFHDVAAMIEQSPTGLEAPHVLLGSGEQSPLILHCWRGGMRSQSVALLLRVMGQDVGIVDGGYKAYRQWLMAQFQLLQPSQLRFIVLRGPTGVGKTDILRRMELIRPGSTLDLEGLAAHRSSVLGAVGLEPVSQPRFESLLWQRLVELGMVESQSQPQSQFQNQRQPTPNPLAVFVEGESRKVGNAEIPAAVFAAMDAAPQVSLTASTEYRIDQLGGEYLATDEHRRQTIASLPALEKMLGRRVIEEMGEQIRGDDWRKAAATLLERHYDPLYRRGDLNRKWLAEFEVSAAQRMAEQLLDLLSSPAIGKAFGG